MNSINCGVCYNDFKQNLIKQILTCNCKEKLCDDCLKILVLSNTYICPYCRNENIVETFLEMKEKNYNNDNGNIILTIHEIMENSRIYQRNFLLNFKQIIKGLTDKDLIKYNSLLSEIETLRSKIKNKQKFILKKDIKSHKFNKLKFLEKINYRNYKKILYDKINESKISYKLFLEGIKRIQRIVYLYNLNETEYIELENYDL